MVTFVCIIYDERNYVVGRGTRMAQMTLNTNDIFRTMVEDSAVGQYMWQDGYYQYINPAFAEIFGYSREEFMEKRIGLEDLFFDEDIEFAFQQGRKMAQSGIPYKLRAKKKDGSTIYVQIHSHEVKDSRAIMGTLLDVTEQAVLQEDLEESEQRYKSLFMQNPNAVYSFDLEGNFLSANLACEKITGYTVEELHQQSFIPLIVVEDLGKTLHHFEEAKKGNAQHFEIAIQNTKGERVELACTALPIVVNGKIIGIFGIAKDITAQKQAELTANYFAYYDPLTDLPNRRLFDERLSNAFSQAKRDNESMAVMFLDIDRFKLINDSFGHDYGDKLIEMVATRIKNQVRGSDTVARMGGDEFCILLPVLKGEEEAVQIARRIVEAVDQPFLIDGMEINTSASIGICLNWQCEDCQTLLKHADIAMYHVKKQGKNNYMVYTEEMDTNAIHQLKLENDLRRALELEEFELHYQPIIELSTGKISGMEALLRWNHPELGTIPPMEFIPIAEESGQINIIGEWVLNTACQQNKEWHDTGLVTTRMAVNVSIKQLQQIDFVEMVQRILTETGMESKWLDLEITESMMMQNQRTISDSLTKLRKMGVNISIDDFGTGYSSLSYLKQLPIDHIKIDKAFIHDLDEQSGSAIVKAVLTLARQLNLKAIAEGVETDSQLTFLKQESCNESQGNHFSKPISASMIKGFVGAREEEKAR
jgi:diguanylate cyclase (GGDEF)-like protein/PAS domain S-box-containing protein